MGGIFNPLNINSYQYALNNPTKITDPDGKAALLRRDIGGLSGLKDLVLNDSGPGHSLIAFQRNGQIYVAQYGPYGVRVRPVDIPTNNYIIIGAGYDDNLMYQAVLNVERSNEFRKDNYNLLTNNCHDFTKAVMNEYKSLFIKREMGNSNNLLSRIKAEIMWICHNIKAVGSAGININNYREYRNYERK